MYSIATTRLLLLTLITINHKKYQKITNMKKTAFLSLLISAILISACGVQKVNYTKQEELEKIKKEPFSDKQYKSDKEFFRASGSGLSPNLSMAKKMALTDVQRKITEYIQVNVQTTTNEYMTNKTIDTESAFASTIMTATQTSAKEVLSNITVKGEELYVKGDKRYEAWIVVEVSKKGIADRIAKGLSSSSSKVLKIDIDPEKFRQMLEQEMSKLDN